MTVEIKCKIIKLADAAALVDHDGEVGNYQWVPYSMMDIDAAMLVVGEVYDFELPHWFAMEKEMI